MALRSIDLGVSDVKANAKFYADVWALEQVAEENGSVYLRGTGAEHHILALHPRPRVELLSVNLMAPDKAAVDGLHAKAKGFGVTSIDEPATVAEPGGGYGFGFKDDEGRILRILSDVETNAAAEDVADRPRKLSHAVFNSSGADKATEFFVDMLGFKVSDRTRMMNFIRCNSDHHSIALVHGDGATLHHIAYEMPDLDSVMRGAGRMRDNGHPIEWGVGRHGPGNNVFSYFLGPEDVIIEYTGDVEQVDDSYPEGGPDDWKWPPGRIDRWGVAIPPTKRMEEAQTRIAFAEPLFQAAE